MSRFCPARSLRPLAAIGQASSKASSSRILLASTSRHLPGPTVQPSTPTLALRYYGNILARSSRVEHEDELGMQDEDVDEGGSQWVRFPKKRRARTTVIVRNFDAAKTTLDDIKQLMEPFGAIKVMNMHGRAVCQVEYVDMISARRAIYKHKSYPLQLNDQPLYVNFAVDVVQVGKPSNALWVSGIDTSSRVDLQELKELFEQFGDVENIILNRKGLPTCIVRYSCVEDAQYAINRHQGEQLLHHGLALQLRYSDSRPSEARQPNPTVHVMGFCGNQSKLLSYVSDYVHKVKDVYLSNTIGEDQERRDVFITFDSTQTAEEASAILNRQLGLVAQFAWPKKSRSEAY